MVIKCPKCSAEAEYAENDSNFCQECGSPLKISEDRTASDWDLAERSKEIAEKIQPQFAETELETLTKIVARYHEQDTWKEDLVFEESSFNLLLDILESAGELDKRPPYEDLVNNIFSKEAVAK